MIKLRIEEIVATEDTAINLIGQTKQNNRWNRGIEYESTSIIIEVFLT